MIYNRVIVLSVNPAHAFHPSALFSFVPVPVDERVVDVLAEVDGVAVHAHHVVLVLMHGAVGENTHHQIVVPKKEKEASLYSPWYSGFSVEKQYC